MSLSKIEEYALNYNCTGKEYSKCIDELKNLLNSGTENKEELKRKIKQKEQKFHNIQLAYKILMNSSLYGYFGTKTSRFYRVEISEAITLTGQEESKRVQEALEKEGYNILYGDTDSMFILVDKVPNEIKNDMEKSKVWIKNNFVPKINKIAQETLSKLASEIGIKNPVLNKNYFFHFKQEMIARSGIFLYSTKGDDAKKRYDLWVIDEENVPKDKITSAGTPLKQSKLPNLVKDYFLKFINKLLKEMSSKDELINVTRELRKKIITSCDNWDLDNLGSLVQFNKPLENYDSTKTDAKFALKWNQSLVPLLKLPSYQQYTKYKFIEVVIKNSFDSKSLQKYFNETQINAIKNFYQFCLNERIKSVAVVDQDNKKVMEIFKSIFILDKERIVKKYVENIFKPYFAVLEIPIERMIYDLGEIDDLL